MYAIRLCKSNYWLVKVLIYYYILIIIKMKKSVINELATKEALKSNMRKKYGCAIVYRNQIIGLGFNFCNETYSTQCVLWALQIWYSCGEMCDNDS